MRTTGIKTAFTATWFKQYFIRQLFNSLHALLQKVRIQASLSKELLLQPLK